MTSLSRLAGRLGDVVWLSFGHAQFEFLLPLPTAAGAAGLGVAVLVSSGARWAMSAHAGRAGHLSPLKRMLGKNIVASWWKTTRVVA